MKYIFFLVLISLCSHRSDDVEHEDFLASSVPLSHTSSEIGKIIDRYNGVPVYYNGEIGNVFGRNTTHDGYNLGLKYQCVEYVKRYYYYRLDHKMTDTYGHAKDFFDESLEDSEYNESRGLYQFANGSKFPPMEADILVFGATPHNPFGHIGIVTKIKEGKLQIIQQNVGRQSRAEYRLLEIQDRHYIEDKYVLGWLRKA
ncbi:MAG: CHAP domain-containing protein [Saprospiraceae bacterium]|nr:CHAP domain-containing protein [Saprospiraceae bacterium]